MRAWETELPSQANLNFILASWQARYIISSLDEVTKSKAGIKKRRRKIQATCFGCLWSLFIYAESSRIVHGDIILLKIFVLFSDLTSYKIFVIQKNVHYVALPLRRDSAHVTSYWLVLLLKFCKIPSGLKQKVISGVINNSRFVRDFVWFALVFLLNEDQFLRLPNLYNKHCISCISN